MERISCVTLFIFFPSPSLPLLLCVILDTPPKVSRSYHTVLQFSRWESCISMHFDTICLVSLRINSFFKALAKQSKGIIEIADYSDIRKWFSDDTDIHFGYILTIFWWLLSEATMHLKVEALNQLTVLFSRFHKNIEFTNMFLL